MGRTRLCAAHIYIFTQRNSENAIAEKLQPDALYTSRVYTVNRECATMHIFLSVKKFASNFSQRERTMQTISKLAFSVYFILFDLFFFFILTYLFLFLICHFQCESRNLASSFVNIQNMKDIRGGKKFTQNVNYIRSSFCLTCFHIIFSYSVFVFESLNSFSFPLSFTYHFPPAATVFFFSTFSQNIYNKCYVCLE